MNFAITFLALGWTAGNASGAKLTTLYSFDGTDGANPQTALVQATNGDLYGTTLGELLPPCTPGGVCGTVFKISPSGTLTSLHSFCTQNGCPDGELPFSGLVQATNGDLYGVTQGGGAHGGGTVFKITPYGTLTTIYNFCAQIGCGDGQTPGATLFLAANGELYGITYAGGAYGGGTVFKIAPGGTLTTLYSFCAQSNCTDGQHPSGGLAKATNGDFYGTTPSGGAHGGGTVFKMTPAGTLTTLYSFCAQAACTDGQQPSGGLTQASNGDFYGTTQLGGRGSGTVFKITPGGKFTTLHSFCAQTSCPDGQQPNGGLAQATNGDLYGTTFFGGVNGSPTDRGTIFKITPRGALTTLYSFCAQTACGDGFYPAGGLLQDTNGNLYGTTLTGGANGGGTVFRLSVGLGKFVETQPIAGQVGEAIKILGSNLANATSVTFNGIEAEF